MATYTETKQRLDEIEAKSANLIRRGSNLLASALAIQSELAALQSDNTAFMTQLNVDAAANAGNPAWDALSARKDLLVTEFQVEKADADSRVTNLQSV